MPLRTLPEALQFAPIGAESPRHLLQLALVARRSRQLAKQQSAEETAMCQRSQFRRRGIDKRSQLGNGEFPRRSECDKFRLNLQPLGNRAVIGSESLD